MGLRNVIYYNSGNPLISLGGMAQLPYTDVIVANLQPTSPTDLTLTGWGNAFDPELQNNIGLLHQAGKRVLISFGGALNNQSGLTTAAYQYWWSHLNELLSQLISIVTNNHYDGIDIDYEDDAGFGDNAAYDGVGFLTTLTNALYTDLGSHNIITHAPAPPFWDSNSMYARGGIAPYYQIWKNLNMGAPVGPTGGDNQIAWFNNQFYDNSDYDATAYLKVEKYQAIAGLTGPENQMLGALVGNPALYPGQHDEGYLSLADMENYVIAPLIAKYGSQFGGVMGWEFWQDGPPTYGSPGDWAHGIDRAFEVGRPGGG